MRNQPNYFSTRKIEVNSNLPRLIEEFKEAYTGTRKTYEVPPRTSITREEPFKAFDVMPAFSEKEDLFITKIGAIIPGMNEHSVNTMVIAFSSITGDLIGVFDGDEITKLKCAAITGLVTSICSRPGSKTLGIVGSGVQARQQIRGISSIRGIEKVKIYSRDKKKIQRFIDESESEYPKIQFQHCGSVQEVLKETDILSTTTTSFHPLFSSTELENLNIHINCMGNHTPTSREVPLKILENSFLIVEDRDTAIREAGEVHKKALSIDQLLLGDPKKIQKEISIFSSTGHALLDLITVSHIAKNMGLI